MFDTDNMSVKKLKMFYLCGIYVEINDSFHKINYNPI